MLMPGIDTDVLSSPSVVGGCTDVVLATAVPVVSCTDAARVVSVVVAAEVVTMLTPGISTDVLPSPFVVGGCTDVILATVVPVVSCTDAACVVSVVVLH